MADNPSPRYAAVDALRGLIMMVMAIDHSSAYIARQHSSEYYNGAISLYKEAFPFLTRLVTHLSAPGFFFLLGASLYWFMRSRLKVGWTQTQILQRTALRGLAIFLVGQIFETPVIYTQSILSPALQKLSRMPMAPPNDATSLWWGFITLSGLGLVMVVCSLLLRLSPHYWLATSALCVLATHTLLPAGNQTNPAWLNLLFSPGISQHIVVAYPVIPWLAVSSFGLFFAHYWTKKPSSTWQWGAALVAIALVLRAVGGPGNLALPRDNSWIEFLNNVKYPPSLVFWTLSVGTSLLLLAALERLPALYQSPRSPLLVFGQTPLFYYIVHFYVLTALALLFFPQAAPLETAYAMWLVVLVIMYPLCLAYRHWKMKKPPESLWRLF
jgi:uncharacterized membrane protein